MDATNALWIAGLAAFGALVGYGVSTAVAAVDRKLDTTFSRVGGPVVGAVIGGGIAASMPLPTNIQVGTGAPVLERPHPSILMGMFPRRVAA